MQYFFEQAGSSEPMVPRAVTLEWQSNILLIFNALTTHAGQPCPLKDSQLRKL